MPDIMNLAEEVLQIFMSKDCFTIQNVKIEKRDIIQANIYRNFPNDQVRYTFDTNCMSNIIILGQAVI